MTLSAPTTSDVTFSYRTLMTGTAGEYDLYYYPTSSSNTNTVTIDAGEVSAEILVRLASDSLDEVDESFEIELFNLTAATFESGENTQRATGFILDDDGGVNPAIFVSNPVIVEGDSGTKTAVFELRLSQPAATGLTVTYETLDGSAKAGEDYVAKTGSLTFSAGQQVKTVSVDILGDTELEYAQAFDLMVTPPSDIDNIGAVGTATILDDDGAASPSFQSPRPRRSRTAAPIFASSFRCPRRALRIFPSTTGR